MALSHTVAITELPLKQVIVRFYTMPPKGTAIPEQKRDDRRIEQRHTTEAQAQGIDAQRLQRGKPDSGRQLRDVTYATLDLLISDLRALGFKLVQAFWNEQRRANDPNRPMYVVSFVFGLEGEEIALGPVDLEWFMRRINLAHEKVTIFANPKRMGEEEDFTWRQDTVNCRGAKPDQSPRLQTRMRELGDYSHDEL
ncbi:MAG: hypothetical protein PHI73_04375 [Patescibacteria group bacterium]|nr:hypothetical protein [Patescibacteria group bacterium]